VLAVLPTGCALLLLSVTVWLLRPAIEAGAPQAFGFPTATRTSTRARVTRLPTPTSFIPTCTPEPLVHVVLEGEVLGLIAEEYGTSVEALLEANGLEDVHLISVGLELIIAGARRTPASVATPSPSPTSTSIHALPAPSALVPLDQQVFAGRGANLVLQWSSVRVLDPEAWYEVRVWKDGSAAVQRAWTKSTSWTVPNQLYPGPKGKVFHWDVAVVLRDGRAVRLLSERSQVRTFGWR
jgi:hypothetical protein